MMQRKPIGMRKARIPIGLYQVLLDKTVRYRIFF